MGSGGIDPLVAFQPLPESLQRLRERGPGRDRHGPAGFPSGLNSGVFVGFHGKGGQGGLANEENPLVFSDLATGRYFHFISNAEASIGHLDGLLSTSDSLFVADLVPTGSIFSAADAGKGVIYQIRAIPPRPDGVLFADDFSGHRPGRGLVDRRRRLGAGRRRPPPDRAGRGRPQEGLRRRRRLPHRRRGPRPRQGRPAGPAATTPAPASASATTPSGAATTSSSTRTPTPCSSSTTTSPGATATTSPGRSAPGTTSPCGRRGASSRQGLGRRPGGARGLDVPPGRLGLPRRAPGLNGGAYDAATASFDDFRVTPASDTLFADDFAAHPHSRPGRGLVDRRRRTGSRPAASSARPGWARPTPRRPPSPASPSPPTSRSAPASGSTTGPAATTPAPASASATTPRTRLQPRLPPGHPHRAVPPRPRHLGQPLRLRLAGRRLVPLRPAAGGGRPLGKVWADGQAEPEGWMFRQDGWASRAGRRGSTAAPTTPPPPASTTSG